MKYLISAICVLTICGCIERQTNRDIKPFEIVELESCLGIMVDMSSSFATNWDDRAYQLFLQLMDEFFTTGAGAEAKVVVGQLSGADPVVLFEGRPNELRKKFQNPEDLNKFLQESSDQSSSRVYTSTRKMLDYVGSLNGVSDQTRMVTVILSDMADNEADPERWRQPGDEMVASLQAYHEKRGAIALYFVSQDETARWNQILKTAGFKPGEYVIETALTNNPQLPRLD